LDIVKTRWNDMDSPKELTGSSYTRGAVNFHVLLWKIYPNPKGGWVELYPQLHPFTWGDIPKAFGVKSEEVPVACFCSFVLKNSYRFVVALSIDGLLAGLPLFLWCIVCSDQGGLEVPPRRSLGRCLCGNTRFQDNANSSENSFPNPFTQASKISSWSKRETQWNRQHLLLQEEATSLERPRPFLQSSSCRSQCLSVSR